MARIPSFIYSAAWAVGNMAADWPSLGGLRRYVDNIYKKLDAQDRLHDQQKKREDKAPGFSRGAEKYRHAAQYLDKPKGTWPTQDKIIEKTLGKRYEVKSPEYQKAKERDNADRALAEAVNAWTPSKEAGWAFHERWKNAKTNEDKLALLLDPKRTDPKLLDGAALGQFAEYKLVDLSNANDDSNFKKVYNKLQEVYGADFGRVLDTLGAAALKKSVSVGIALTDETRKKLVDDAVANKGYLQKEAEAIFGGVKTEEEAKLLFDNLPELPVQNKDNLIGAEKKLKDLDGKKDKNSQENKRTREELTREINNAREARARAFMNNVTPYFEKMYGADIPYEADKLPEGVTGIATAARWLYDSLQKQGADVDVPDAEGEAVAMPVEEKKKGGNGSGKPKKILPGAKKATTDDKAPPIKGNLNGTERTFYKLKPPVKGRVITPGAESQEHKFKYGVFKGDNPNNEVEWYCEGVGQGCHYYNLVSTKDQQQDNTDFRRLDSPRKFDGDPKNYWYEVTITKDGDVEKVYCPDNGNGEPDLRYESCVDSSGKKLQPPPQPEQPPAPQPAQPPAQDPQPQPSAGTTGQTRGAPNSYNPLNPPQVYNGTTYSYEVFLDDGSKAWCPQDPNESTDNCISPPAGR